jgi:hypothetical protein
MLWCVIKARAKFTQRQEGRYKTKSRNFLVDISFSDKEGKIFIFQGSSDERN